MTATDAAAAGRCLQLEVHPVEIVPRPGRYRMMMASSTASASTRARRAAQTLTFYCWVVVVVQRSTIILRVQTVHL